MLEKPHLKVSLNVPCLPCASSRTALVNYRKVLWHVLEFIMAQLLGFMIGRNFLQPTFELFHNSPVG